MKPPVPILSTFAKMTTKLATTRTLGTRKRPASIRQHPATCWHPATPLLSFRPRITTSHLALSSFAATGRRLQQGLVRTSAPNGAHLAPRRLGHNKPTIVGIPALSAAALAAPFRLHLRALVKRADCGSNAGPSDLQFGLSSSRTCSRKKVALQSRWMTTALCSQLICVDALAVSPDSGSNAGPLGLQLDL